MKTLKSIVETGLLLLFAVAFLSLGCMQATQPESTSPENIAGMIILFAVGLSLLALTVYLNKDRIRKTN